MKIVIVIPTYNEGLNIGKMIDALLSEFKNAVKHEWHILVVDGNSPDDTAAIVEKKAVDNSCIHLILEKEKAGLGAAYLYGFSYALDVLRADVLVEMDADFQHDPKDVVRLITEIDNGYDYVIGSRFVSGGSIPKDWAFYRKFLSVGGNVFSRLVLGILNISDFTSGFKATRVAGFADKLDFKSILSNGFAYKIDLLYKIYKLGARIKEIPISFGVRDRGVSKMEKNNFMDSLKVVLSIRYRESQRFIKFCIVGFFGLFVDAVVFNVLRVDVFSSTISALISGFCAMLSTFILNNYWSFKDSSIKSPSAKIKGFLLYLASSTVPILFRSKLVYWGVLTFGDTLLMSNIMFFVGVVFGLIWNFIVYNKIIWKKK